MTTGPTEDAAMRRFAAAWADNGGCGRDRLVIEAHHAAFDTHAVELLAVQVSLGSGEQRGRALVIACGARQRDARALPQLVMVDLRHRRAETILQLRLHGPDELPLPLQGTRLGKVQLGGEDADVTRAHGAEPLYDAVAVAGVSRSVRSTWRVSYASSTSRSLTSLKPSRRMPHSKPSCTSRTSSLTRRSEAIVVS